MTTEPPGHLYRLFWRWHFYAALLVIPFVLWQSTTGTLYLWSQWWMDVRHPELRFGGGDAPAVPLAAQVAAALAGAPSARVQEIVVPGDPRRSTTVMLMTENGLPRPVFVDPRGGAVLGTLPATAWLPGLSRALHGGWPAGAAGSWLLELGDCWALIMVVTGLYLWWPRHRPFLRALWPRFGAGPRRLLRDLHSCVAVWFAGLLLFFLVSALPWTRFWGGEILRPIERLLDQESPAGFSPGGATADRLQHALPTLDGVVARMRETGVRGDLTIRLAPWPEAPWWLRNQNNPPGTDRYLLADPRDGVPLAELGGADLPLLPRLVALGVHVHQGDFGPVNRWLNTALAAALVWLSATGIWSWWDRRPPGRFGAPPAPASPPPRALVWAFAALCALLPLLGLSALLIWGADTASKRARALIRTTS